MNATESLDPVLRLHVLAAALPGAAIAERTLDAGFENVWGVVTDLEKMAPRYETHVDAIKIIERQGDRARVVATLRGGRVEAMEVRMVPGWCLMQSEYSIVGFGARPDGQQTLLAHFEYDRKQSPFGNARLADAAHARLVRELDTIGSLARELAAPAPEDRGQE